MNILLANTISHRYFRSAAIKYKIPSQEYQIYLGLIVSVKIEQNRTDNKKGTEKWTCVCSAQILRRDKITYY
jgi:hypothetical protein